MVRTLIATVGYLFYCESFLIYSNDTYIFDRSSLIFHFSDVRAITVHKSQGTTLSRAQLMIRNTFDSGQAYVALSRVTGFEGLWLTKPLTKESIRADQDALEYYGYSTFDD